MLTGNLYRKLLALALCLVFALAFAGCRQEQEAASSPETAVGEQPTEAAAAVTEDTVNETQAHLEEALTEQLRQTLPTEAAVETVLKSQYDQLEESYTRLTLQQEKTRRLAVIAIAAAGVLLAGFLTALFFWLRNAGRLKKQRRRRPGGPGIRAVSVGKVHGIGARSSQQDSFTVSGPEDYPAAGTLAVVADGMGGMADGDKASQTAVMSAVNLFLCTEGQPREKLISMMAAAKTGMEQIRMEDTGSDCGTTLVLALLQKDFLDFASVGDSRICLYRGGNLQCLNREHTYQQKLFRDVINGDISYAEAMADNRRGCIACYLGMGDLPVVDIPSERIRLLPEDKVILMSDGVYNALSTRELCLALQYPAQEAAEAIESFIHSKNYPDQDNYTAVILECL